MLLGGLLHWGLVDRGHGCGYVLVLNVDLTLGNHVLLSAGGAGASVVKLRNKVLGTKDLVAQVALDWVHWDALALKTFNYFKLFIGDARIINQVFGDPMMVSFAVMGRHQELILWSHKLLILFWRYHATHLVAIYLDLGA